HGFEQYETSAYAQPGRRCHHNLNYWRFGDYLGLGAGAHGKLSGPEGITRRWKLKQPKDYLAHAGDARAIGGESRLTPDDAASEFMLNASRLTDGFDIALFGERAGLALATLQPALRAAQDKGLLDVDAARIRPTALGRRFLNDLQLLFLPATNAAANA